LDCVESVPDLDLKSQELPVKIVATIARYLLGLIFLFFGSNLLFHFLPNPPMPSGPMADFSLAMAKSHYTVAVGFFQVAPAILLLINRYVPLALTVLAAELVNILTFHITMQPAGLPMALVVSILWVLVFLRVTGAFSGIFEPLPQR
jgi:putative oxidoreductase